MEERRAGVSPSRHGMCGRVSEILDLVIGDVAVAEGGKNWMLRWVRRLAPEIFELRCLSIRETAVAEGGNVG